MIWLLALQLALTPQQNTDDAARNLSRLDLTAAERDVDAALRQDPYLVSALILKADLALFAKQPDIARSCLIAAVVGHPTSPSAQLALGVFYYGQGSFELALSPLATAHQLSPLDAKVSLYLARSYEALHRHAEATRFYQEAEQQTRKSPAQTAPVLIAYGRYLTSQGRYPEAIGKERLALVAQSQSRDAHYELARALDLKGDYRDAADEGELALKVPPPGASDTLLHMLLHKVYLQLHEPDLARSHESSIAAASAAAIP